MLSLTFMLAITITFGSVATAQTILAKATGTLFKEVPLTESVTTEEAGIKTELKKVSHGLRQKTKFGLITVSVYVAEFFAKDSSKLNKTSDGILNSLKLAGPVQLRLTMSRDLTGTQISDSFKEALKANGIDTEKTTKELTEILTAVGEIKKFKSNETFSVTTFWNDSMATLWIQKPDLTIQKITGPEKLANDFLSIWFGKPVDNKLEELKKALLK